jgi:HK97 family phage major capsid protein
MTLQENFLGGFLFGTEDFEMIDKLRQKLEDIQEQVKNIINAVQAEDREFTEEESDKLEALEAEFKNTDRQVKNLVRAEEREKKLREVPTRVTDPDDEVRDAQNKGMQVPKGARLSLSETPEMRRNNGFRSLGEFAMSVKNAMPGGGGNIDPRLVRNAPTTTSTEGVGADGGYLVPPDYRTAIVQQVMGEDTVLGRTDQWITNSNQIVVPADETTPWQSSGGVQVYWESEAGQKSQSKVALKEKTLRLNKLTALCPVSDELLEDASALDSYLSRKVAEKFNFAINLAIVQGTGVGEPQGIMNCGCKIAVDAESGQSADTIVFENIVNMWSRMYGPSRPNAVWLINQDIEPQLYTMSFEGTSSSVPAYLPAGGLSSSPYSTLMGKPIIPTQACETLGDAGDIILADLKQYWTGLKSTGMRQDVSIHLWFDYDVTAFRFIMRLGGQCWFSAAISGRDTGTSTMSSFITLAARA